MPEGFENVVRLFPLPNVVLFPGVVQALHLFEPRYCELMNDALAGDELITMAFIKPDWAAEVSANPEIAETVCVGKILSHTQLDNGCFNLFLVGTKRARIVTELEMPTPYRMAEVQILDEDRVEHSPEIVDLRFQIVDKFRSLVALRPSWNHEALDLFLDDDLPFGQLVDMICYSCGADPVQQQAVLELNNLGTRGRMVLDILQEQVDLGRKETGPKEPDGNEPASGQDFPPGFSIN